MTERERIENEIRDLLATETRTTVLSNLLFEQGKGLFTKLASTKEEWKSIFQTELFRSAQARVRELQYRDGDALYRAAQVIKEHVPELDQRLILDARDRAL